MQNITHYIWYFAQNISYSTLHKTLAMQSVTNNRIIRRFQTKNNNNKNKQKQQQQTKVATNNNKQTNHKKLQQKRKKEKSGIIYVVKNLRMKRRFNCLTTEDNNPDVWQPQEHMCCQSGFSMIQFNSHATTCSTPAPEEPFGESKYASNDKLIFETHFSCDIPVL